MNLSGLSKAIKRGEEDEEEEEEMACPPKRRLMNLSGSSNPIKTLIYCAIWSSGCTRRRARGGGGLGRRQRGREVVWDALLEEEEVEADKQRGSNTKTLFLPVTHPHLFDCFNAIGSLKVSFSNRATQSIGSLVILGPVTDISII